MIWWPVGFLWSCGRTFVRRCTIALGTPPRIQYNVNVCSAAAADPHCTASRSFVRTPRGKPDTTDLLQPTPLVVENVSVSLAKWCAEPPCSSAKAARLVVAEFRTVSACWRVSHPPRRKSCVARSKLPAWSFPMTSSWTSWLSASMGGSRTIGLESTSRRPPPGSAYSARYMHLQLQTWQSAPASPPQ